MTQLRAGPSYVHFLAIMETPMSKKATTSKGPAAPTKEQAKVLAEFRQEMTDKVIPKIVKVVEERRVLASKSRRWPLKS